jgi:hypothetical protein
MQSCFDGHLSESFAVIWVERSVDWTALLNRSLALPIMCTYWRAGVSYDPKHLD